MNKHLHADRNITHADKAFKSGMTINGFSNHSRRVSEVNHPCIRTKFFDIFYDVKNHRNGTQTFKQTARAVGFLAKITMT
ncbi:Uncharacterised protein [Shigella sonnei]|nr:Uncharacterised protein [Shigella sonnei]CST15091.1 Uncharacterised protein [Shigella sonnei]